MELFDINRKPFSWLNENSMKILRRGYILENEDPIERFRFIAEKAEERLKADSNGEFGLGFADKFFDYLSRGWYSLSSPIVSNFGREGKVLPISCNGSYVEDSMEGILSKVGEVGMMTKMGAGTSVYLGDIRPRGSGISIGGGKTSGPCHFAELFQSVTNVVSQTGVRRGACAVYLDAHHRDALEFLDFKEPGSNIKNLTFGMCFSDEWMNDLLAKKPENMAVWQKVIEKRFKSGLPYIFFTDNVQRNKAQVYIDKAMKVHASNLCVSGDQRVPTQFGLLTAKELYEKGEKLTLFDNEKIVDATKMHLVERNVPTFKITLSNGLTHTVTGYHKLVKRVEKTNSTEQVACSELKIGDQLKIQSNKGIFGTKSMEKEAFLLGLYQADGTQHNDIIMLDLWENNFDLVAEVEEAFEYIHYQYGCNEYVIPLSNGNTIIRSANVAKFHDCVVREGSPAKKRLASKTLKKALNFEKGVIPNWIWEADELTQWQYIRGLFYCDGTVAITKGKGSPLCLSYSSINQSFLKDLQILLANLGITSNISILRPAGKALLPDGKGGKSEYNTKTCYRLTSSSKLTAKDFDRHTGFLTRKGIDLDQTFRDSRKKFYDIISIEPIGNQDVYCCTVDSQEHEWVCNGLVTVNCTEIILPSSQEESFVCNLASLNMVYYDEWKNTDAIELLVYFLDAVMSEYIEKTADIPFMIAAHKFAKRHRALGIGCLGWSTYLQSKLIPFGSAIGQSLNVEVWRNIRERAEKASETLAQVFGEPELLQGYNKRNTTLLAIAPTRTTAYIFGQVSQGIQPYFANYYVDDISKLKVSLKNPALVKLLQELGRDTDEVWNDILYNQGSVQQLDFLNDRQKETFKTFEEVSPMDIIVGAGNRQKYIDQGQSVNLKLSNKTDPAISSRLIIEAWKRGLNTLYYQYSTSAAHDKGLELLECTSCEA